MSFLLTFLLLLLIVTCVGTTYQEGIWSNALRLINVITAALLATNFFEPLAGWLQSAMPSATYLCDFVSLWLLFVGIYLGLSELTNRVSRVKVRFFKMADEIGGGIFGFWIGYVMVCFALMSLHMAPLPRVFLFGGFDPQSRMFFHLAPDHDWLGFMQKMSRGPFSSPASDAEVKQEKYVFDPQGEFMLKYASRRKAFEEQIVAKDSMLAEPTR
jgi:uncharacterized membrane protein required for colicin V production